MHAVIGDRYARRFAWMTALIAAIALVKAGGSMRSVDVPHEGATLWLEQSEALLVIDPETGEILRSESLNPGSALLPDRTGSGDPFLVDDHGLLRLATEEFLEAPATGAEIAAASPEGPSWRWAGSGRVEQIADASSVDWSEPLAEGTRVLALAPDGHWSLDAAGDLEFSPDPGTTADERSWSIASTPKDNCLDALTGDLVVVDGRTITWYRRGGQEPVGRELPGAIRVSCGRSGAVWALTPGSVVRLRSMAEIGALEQVIDLPEELGSPDRLVVDGRDDAPIVAGDRGLGRWSADGELVWLRRLSRPVRQIALSIPAGSAPRGPRPAGDGIGKVRVEAEESLGPGEIELTGRIVDPSGVPVAGAELAAFGREIVRSTSGADGTFVTPAMPAETGDSVLVAVRKPMPAGEVTSYPSAVTATAGSSHGLGDIAVSYPCGIDFEDGLFPAGDLDGNVRAAVVFDDGSGPALYVGGNFLTAGGQTVHQVAKWDGTSWSALGEGLSRSTSPVVYALAVHDDGSGRALYAGGNFTNSGAATVRYVARWTGSQWVQAGNSIGGAVLALASHDTGAGAELYATGSFSGKYRIARLQGSTWNTVDGGLNGTGRALAVYGGDLYVGGSFTTAGGIPASRLARWDGASWSDVAGGVSGGTTIQVNALATWNEGGQEVLIVGGRFTSAGALSARYVARWDGASWSPLGGGLGSQVYALASFDDGWGEALYAGGSFNSVSGQSYARIARWFSGGWETVGSGTVGVNATVYALGTGQVDGVPGLYAGGAFTTASGVGAGRLARVGRADSCGDALEPWIRIVDPSDGESVASTLPDLRFGFADRGSGPDPATLVATLDGAAIPLSCTSSADTADCSPTAPMPLGFHTLEATIRDLAGNLSATHAVGFDISESVPPTLDVVEPAEGAVVESLRPTLRLAYSDVGSGVDPTTLAILWNGGPAALDCQTTASEAICLPLGDAVPGPVTITATVADLQGNVSAPATRNFTVATAAPPPVTTFAGTVRFEDGSPAASAAVWLADEPALSAVTAPDGTYAIAGVETGGATLVRLDARLSDPGPSWLGFTTVAPVAGGTTLADITLRRRCEGGFSRLDLAPESTVLSEVPLSISNALLSFAAFDDGSGPVLYVGGSFNYGSGGELGRIARWSAEGWRPVGSGGGLGHDGNVGTQPDVRALAVFDDGSGAALYAGGSFTVAGGRAAQYLGRWDGTSWQEAGGGTDARVTGLASFDDGSGEALFAAGNFTRVGVRVPWSGGDTSIAAAHVARWDGAVWSDESAGVVPTNISTIPLRLSAFDVSGQRRLLLWEDAGYQIWERVGGTWQSVPLPPEAYGIRAVVVHDDGSGPALFVHAGGIGIRKWNGASWSAVLDDDYQPKWMASFDDGSGGSLYAAGLFTLLPGYDGTDQLRRWSGSTWSPPLGPAREIAAVEGLGPGPSLARIDPQPFATWQGGAWVPVPTGAEIVGSVTSVALADAPGGEVVLFAGPERVGALGLAGGVYSWDGTTVTAGNAGFATATAVLSARDGVHRRVYAVDQASGQVGEWTGSSWTLLGAPLGAAVYDLEWADLGNGRALYAGAGDLFRWSGAFWESLGNPGATVGQIELLGGWLYTRTHRWNGTTWESWGSGNPLTGSESPATSLGGLYFDQESFAPELVREPAAAVAKEPDLDLGEAVQTPLGSGCSAFESFGGQLHVGGTFSSAGGTTHYGYAAWNGSSWGRGVGSNCGFLANRFLSGYQGSSAMRGSVCALETFDDGSGAKLVLGGDFAASCQGTNTASLLPYRNLNLGEGVDGPAVRALAVGTWRGSPALAVGGDFGEAEGERAGRLAVWHAAPDWEGCTTAGLPPTITITSPATPWTNQSQVIVSGRLDEPATLEVNGAAIPVAPDRTFSFPTGPLADGANHFFLRALDAAGLSSELAYQLVRDGEAPSIAFTAPRSGERLFTAAPPLDLVFADGGSGIDAATLEVLANGQPLSPADCTVREDRARCVRAGALPAGPATFVALISDRAGNVSVAAAITVTLDPAAGSTATTIAGSVLFDGGAPAAGARVRLLGRAGVETATLADGSFSLSVAEVLGDAPLQVVAEATQGSQALVAVSSPLTPVPGGTTLAGVLTLRPACDLAASGELFGQVGLDGRVLAAAVYDDGSGPALYLGGSGLLTESGLSRFLVRWTGSRFEAVPGAPGNGSIRALAVFDDGSGPALYVGGSFTSAGGSSASGIARWDGSAWTDLAGGVQYEARVTTTCTTSAGSVYALTVHDDGGGPALYVAGSFTRVGGSIPSEMVARWSAGGWQGYGGPAACYYIGGGLSSPKAYALASYDAGAGARLHVAGSFQSIATVPARNVARLEGGSWVALEAGIGRVVNGVQQGAMVNALAVFDSGDGPALVAAGLFNRAGSSEADRNNVARWNGVRWESLGSGVTASFTTLQFQTGLQALAVHDDGSGPALYVAGRLSGPFGAAYGGTARWSGVAWTPLGSGISEPGEGGMTLASWQGALVVGGGFDQAGGLGARRVARWEEGRWSAFGDGLDGDVRALAVFDDGTGPALYLGGTFLSAGGRRLDHVARWDGSALTPLGGGTDGAVHALEAFDDGAGPALYAGGEFTAAGGAPASLVARWDGSGWQPLAGGLARGSTPKGVWALEAFDDGGGPALYAGGWFDQADGLAAANVARWDGSAWSALGSGVNSRVYALSTAAVGGSTALYAAGDFTTAGGVSAARVARWNGTAWNALSTGLTSTVRALAAWGGDRLLAAGDFSSYARVWNGSSWSTLAGGSPNQKAEAIGLWNDGRGPAAYFGGSFGLPGSRAARWDGAAWSALGAGADTGSVLSLAPAEEASGSALYLGGSFSRFDGTASPRLARWHRPLYCGDTTGPVVSITSPLEASWVAQSRPRIDVTMSDAASGVDPATIELAIDGVPLAATCSTTPATATCWPLADLAEGPRQLRVAVEDLVGNEGSATVGFSVDTLAPGIDFFDPLPGAILTTATPTIRFAFVEDGAGVDPPTLSIRLEANGPAGFDCTYSALDAECVASAPIADTELGFFVTVDDLAGNRAEDVGATFVVDTLAPEVVISEPADGSTAWSDPDPIRLDFLDEGSGVDPGSLQATLDGAPFAPACSFDESSAECVPPAPIAPGAHTLALSLADLAGHRSATATSTFTFTPDADPPSLAFVVPAPGASFDPQVTPFELAWSDAVSGVDEASLLVLANGAPAETLCTAVAGGTACRIPRRLLGAVTLSAEVRDVAGNLSAPATVAIVVPPLVPDLEPPSIEILEPEGDGHANVSPLRIRGRLSETAALTVDGQPTTVYSDRTFRIDVPLVEGSNSIFLEATDPSGNIGQLTLLVELDNTPPLGLDDGLLTYADSVQGEAAFVGAAGCVLSTEPDLRVIGRNLETGAVGVAPVAGDRSFSGLAGALPGDRVEFRVVDLAGNESPAVERVTTGTDPVPQEPDPSGLGSALDSPFCRDYSFLWSGDNPTQYAVVDGAIDCARAAVVRARVIDSQGAPIAGARVRVPRQPGVGVTLTQADGWFYLGVNGGGLVFVEMVADGYLPVQRAYDIKWQAIRGFEDVVLTARSATATTLDLASPDEIQSAQGEEATDAAGTRRPTLLVENGTTAMAKLPDGSTQPLPVATTRMTELTVGDRFEQALPGPLPKTMAPTLVVDLSIDEADNLGATRVDFNQPLPFLVENFLGLPVGTPVAAASWDRGASKWQPETNGIVLGIVSEVAGEALLDLTGDGTPADAAALAVLGISDAERRRIALLYEPGQELVRVAVGHFTPWYLGLGYLTNQAEYYGPPRDLPLPRVPDELRTEGAGRGIYGGAIDAENQILGQALSIAGSPVALTYHSDRVEGRKSPLRLEIPVTGSTVPSSTEKIELVVEVGGRRERFDLPLTPDQLFEWEWDGTDAIGRKASGPSEWTVRIDYFSRGGLTAPGDWLPASIFDLPSGLSVEGDARGLTRISRTARGTFPSFDAKRAFGLGGWGLSILHRYEPSSKTLFFGGGARRTWVFGPQVEETLERVAGTGVPGVAGDDGIARDAQLTGPHGLSATPDGGLLIADRGNCRIRKVDREGILTTVAGTDCSDPLGTALGDGGPATEAHLYIPEKAAQAADGSIYLADTGHGLVRRVRDGVIDTVLDLRSADCTPIPNDLDVDETGAVWVTVLDLDNECSGVWKIRGDGVPAQVAGYWTGPRSVVNLRALDVHRDGVVGIVEGSRLAEISLDGVQPGYDPWATQPLLPGTYAGAFSRDYFFPWDQPRFWGDGMPASHLTRFQKPKHIAIAADRTTYVADSENRRIRVIHPDTYVDTYVGGGEALLAGDGTRVSDAALGTPFGVALSPDGSTLFFSDETFHQVWRVALPAPVERDEYEIPSRNGSVIHVFDREGLHLRTEDSRTRKAIWTFTYATYPATEPNERPRQLVTEIEDAFGNKVTILRGADGTPSAIVAPFGQQTTLGFDGNGYLQTVSRSVGAATETVTIAARPDGLLSTLQVPEGGTYSYQWDDDGRLARVDDAATGSLDLVPSGESREGRTVTGTSAMSRSGNVGVEFLPKREIRWTHTDSVGLDSTALSEKGGLWTTASPVGVQSVTKIGNDRGRLGPLVDDWISSQVTTPGGRTLALTSETTAFQAFPDDELRTLVRTEQVTRNGKVSTVHYDGNAGTVTATSPTGRQSVTLLDAFGRVSEVRPPGVPPVSYTYDTRGRLERVETGSGPELRSSVYTYNATTGYLETVTDSLGRTVTFERDDAGRVTKQILPDLREIRFDYDLNGNLTKLTPPSRPDHVFDHTPLDQLETYTPPDAGFTPRHTAYAYNPDGQPTSVTRPDSQQIVYSYEGNGRLDYVTLPTGVIDVGYDPQGRASSISAPGGVGTTLGYDGHLVTSIATTGPVPGSVTFDYDDDFELTGRTVNGTTFVGYGYDDDGLLTQAGALGLARNAATGFLETTTLGATDDARTYTGFGELDVYTGSVSSSPVLSYDLDRDVSGRITQRTETVEGATTVWEYGYHPQRGWLTEVKKDGIVVESYGYDDNGNRTSWSDFWGSGTAGYDDQDRLPTYGPTSYTYTTNGELLTKTEGPDVTSYDYDVRGALLSVDLPTGVQIDYLVDAGGRRIGKRVDGVLVQGFLYGGGLAPVAELDGSGQIAASFVYATKANVPDYLVRSGTTYRVFTDHLGSVRLVVDTATGAVAQRIDYDPWGRITLDTNPGFQPFGFAGGIYDHQTRLTRFGARDYDPEIGRWTSKDPIGFAGGSAGLYTYAGNDPINRTDRSGLAEEYPEDDSQGPVLPQVDYLRLVQTAGEVAGAIANVILDVVTLLTDPAPGLAGEVECFEFRAELLCGEMKIGVMPIAPRGALPPPSKVPNAAGRIVSFVTPEDRIFYRVFTGDSNVGAFLTATRPSSRAFAQQALDLPPGNTAEFVQEVLVPAGTRLQRSRVRPGAFGGRGGSEQFELLEYIPIDNFGPGVRLP